MLRPRLSPLLLIVWVLGVILTGIVPTSRSQAQEPDAPPPTVELQRPDAGRQEGQVVDPVAFADERATELEALLNPETSAELEPLTLTTNSISDPTPQQQGVVGLTVLISPVRTRTPADLTYTYIYTNTGSTVASGIVLEAAFSKYRKATAPTGNGDQIWQYCTDSLCNVLAGSQQGPAVTREADLTDGAYFRIGDLAPGQSGRFQLRLTTPRTAFPRFDKEPRRPAGSARIYTGVASGNPSGTPVSVASAAALIEGPLFVIEQTRVSELQRIFPLQTIDIKIVLRNESRDDSIDATGVQLINQIPSGAEFVSATGPIQPILETVGGKVRLRWEIPTLNRNGTYETIVRFRKLDVAPCATLANAANLVTVTSNEMPLKNTTERETITARNAASIQVQPPVVISAVSATPNSVPFGDVASITLRVRNYWPAPVNNAVLAYNVQPNATYQAGTATGGSVISVPDGLTSGGTVRWTLNMPAATSITQPSEATFTLGVRGGFTKTGNGLAFVENLGAIPSGCVEGKAGRVSLTERLTLSKSIDGGDKDGSNWLALTGDTIPYVITLSNIGPDPVENIQVVDTIPGGNNSTFSYVSGSATLDDAPIIPIENNVPGGTIIWSGITVQPGETRTLRYAMVAGGTEFQTYCNRIEAEIFSSPGETVRYAPNRACVKLNPNIQITKALVDPTQAVITVPGQEVKFRVTLQNNGTRSYEMALYDALPPFFSFTRAEDVVNVLGAPTLTDDGSVTWPLQAVNVGQRLEATIVTTFTPPCRSQRYTNKLLFQFKETSGSQRTLLVESRPATKADIQYNCGSGQMTYSGSVARRTASLRDAVDFTITIENKNVNDNLSGVQVVNLLPPGFTFEAMLSAFDRPADVLRSDGRRQLTWNLGQPIPPNGRVQLVFRVRTAPTVGVSYENLVYATADNLFVSECKGTCRDIIDDGSTLRYAVQTIEVRPLITITPQISPEVDCANVGATLTYDLTLLNTNIHPYENSVVTTTLPLGLRYVRPLSGPAPNVMPDPDRAGNTLLIWEGITVPQPPAGQVSTQTTLGVELRVGQVWSDQSTGVIADSPDGLIPVADGEINPTIPICIEGPGVAKDASVAEVVRNQEFFYQIEVVNPTDEAIIVSLEDQLPADIQFLSMAVGSNPSLSPDQRTLTWNALTVPATDNDGKPGVRQLLFRVRYTGTEIGTQVNNRVSVLESSTELNQELVQVGVLSVEAVRLLFLPLIQQ